MPLYMISPDQGACPDGHPCHLTPDHPGFRECGQPTHFRGTYAGEALVDVYAGPVGVEAYQHACDSLNDLMRRHEADHNCPGVEVCEGWFAGALRAIRDVLDPLPRDPAAQLVAKVDEATAWLDR